MKNIIEIDGVKYEQTLKKVEETDYLTGHINSGLKVGNKVKVIREANSYEAGWGCDWNPIKNNYVGKILKITRDEGVNGFELNNEWYFPYFVLEKVEEPVEPKIETYGDILKAINPMWAVNTDGNVVKCSNAGYMYLDQYASEEYAQVASARLKLENVVHYLNEIKYKDVDWEPQYWSICLSDMEITTEFCSFSYLDGNIKFKRGEIAEEAIHILGEETIKLALK